jgi:hypothetical protein
MVETMGKATDLGSNPCKQQRLYVFYRPRKTNVGPLNPPPSRLGFYSHLFALCTNFLDSSKFRKKKKEENLYQWNKILSLDFREERKNDN